jgi:dipeptidyl aminopeptidase/acylaminoacyl peptidase
VDRRADIWSFGVVLYEMLSGCRLYSGEMASDMLAAVILKDPDWETLPATTPARIRELLQRCLRKDPKMRLRDIGDARIAIDEYLAKPDGPSVAVAAPAPAAAKRTPLWLAAAAAALAVGLAGLSAVHFSEKPPDPAPVRFQIPAPEKASFGNGMAISPDGKRLAFVGNSEGRTMLWVRPLESLAAQVLPGTEGAAFPFWSPDSRFIGYSVLGKLKKVDASGGPPQTLCDAPNTAIGGSWNRDGVIVFGTNGTGLFRVSQAGGAPAQLTTPDAKRQESFHGRPWFLPDGNHFLYYAQSAALEDSGIYLATLEGNPAKRLVLARQGGAYVPPSGSVGNGHLLFLREGTLMAQPLDAKTFELAGDAFPVAEQVGSNISNPFFSVSTNGVLVYRSGGSAGNTQLAWFGRDGKPLGVLGPIGLYNDVALSPDARRVAVSKRDPQGGHLDIWLMDVAHGVPTRFTFDPGLDTYPVWSPDGSRLVFASSRDGALNLYQKGSAGAGSEELLFKSDREKRSFDWSGDGRYLLYAVQDQKTKLDLWLLPDAAVASAERKPRPFLTTPYNESQGQFSPGPAGTPRWIAYASDESGRFEVYVEPFSESSSAPAGKFQISSDGGVQPRWRRDGRELYYIAPDGRLMAADVKTSPQFDHGVPTPLFQSRILGGGGGTGLGVFRYSPAPDGKRFLINSQAEEVASSPITAVLNWTAALKR